MKVQEAFSNFGSYISFSVDNSVFRLGKLIKISISEDEEIELGIDVDDIIKSYACEKVVLEKNLVREENKIKFLIDELRKEIDLFLLTLYAFNEEKIDDLFEKISDKVTKLRFSECMNQYRPGQKMYEAALQKLEQSELEPQELQLLKGILACRCQNYQEAYHIFAAQWIKNPYHLENCINFFLVAKETKNDVLCFYLLKQIFRTEEIWNYQKSCRTVLWWKFVQYSVRYGDFSIFRQIVPKSANSEFLLKAMIYTFYAYNMGNLCERMMPLLDERIEEQIQKIQFFMHYFPEDSDTYYKRGELGIEQIIKEYNDKQNLFGEEQIKGYVYEYIYDKKSGYLIGADFQNYFYREEDVSKNLLEMIRENISSKLEVQNQDLLKVWFVKKQIGEKRRASQLKTAF